MAGREVVVVGAGIAGLTAAYYLQEAGVPVRVLEASPGPGGRMTSHGMAGGVLEQGAQFLTTAYAVIPELIDKLGLADAVISVADRSAVVIGGRLRCLDVGRPLRAVTNGLLPVHAVPHLLFGAARVRLRSRSASVAPDLASWAAYDDRAGDVWAKKVLGPAATGRLLAPTVFGLYFQQLADNSAALAASVTGFGVKRATAFTLRGGLGTLTAALARRLPVDYGAEVREVLVTAEGARVQTQDSEYDACCVVLAVPGARAEELLPGADAPTAALLGTPYSPALLIGLSLRRSLRPEEFEGAYGVLFHPADQPVVAAAAVFSRANHTGRPDADVLTVMFSPEAARRLRDAPEAEVKAEAVQALRAHLPPLERLVTGTRVVRWDQAMPLTPIDQAARVKDYRDHLPPGSRLVLAGDYLGFPWSDSAAYNGRWAARHLLESGSPVTSQ